MPTESAPDATNGQTAPPSIVGLFVAFAKMSLMGFGGVLVWARRAIVEQNRWLTAEEFNEVFALCHFLPGPNTVNLSMVFGSRLRGLLQLGSVGLLECPGALLGLLQLVVGCLSLLIGRFQALLVAL